jgi:membrane protein
MTAESGKEARHPAQFQWRAWWAILRRVAVNIGVHNLSIVAAGVAFFGVFSIFPAIATLIPLYGLFADPANLRQILDEIEPFLPGPAFDIVRGQVETLLNAPPQALGLASGVALLLTLWSARAGVTALIQGLNIVYRQTESRGLIAQYVLSLVLTLAVLVAAVLALLVVVALPGILQFVTIGPVASLLATLVPQLVLGFAVAFIIGALYRYGPDRAHAKTRWISVGALAATVLWVIASLLLAFYVSNFANFNKTYGSLGAIIALLFWLYASAFVVLLGAELDAEMELQTARDTTSGRPKPMGERGAYVADHVA